MRRAVGLIGAAAAAALLVQGAAQAQPRAQDVNPTPMPPGSRAGNAPAMNPGPGAAGPANNVPGVRAERVNPTPMAPGSVAGNAPGMNPGTAAGAPDHQSGTRAQQVNPSPMPPGSVAGQAPGMNPAGATQGTQPAQTSGTTQGTQPTQATGTAQGTQPAQTTGTTQGSQRAPAAGAATPGRAVEGGGATSSGLEPGANSFTAEQARERIGEAGFGDVQQLRLDEQGIWRGRAVRDGQPTGVAMDFRGRIAPTP
ncbi:hypothetical protein [Falsiroseomonas bella]|nr:hypothetical protein [Falsiroseomonas bella]